MKYWKKSCIFVCSSILVAIVEIIGRAVDISIFLIVWNSIINVLGYINFMLWYRIPLIVCITVIILGILILRRAILIWRKDEINTWMKFICFDVVWEWKVIQEEIQLRPICPKCYLQLTYTYTRLEGNHLVIAQHKRRPVQDMWLECGDCGFKSNILGHEVDDINYKVRQRLVRDIRRKRNEEIKHE